MDVMARIWRGERQHAPFLMGFAVMSAPARVASVATSAQASFTIFSSDPLRALKTSGRLKHAETKSGFRTSASASKTILKNARSKRRGVMEEEFLHCPFKFGTFVM
ncbi:MAG: hypothetical protein P9C25_07370 [Defluviicoccus sp.]|nr:hypothetical protein [Defluviicoccus sp.]